MARRIASIFAAAALLSGAAHAALVKEDLHTAGDGLITLDTATNLEWLNVTATQDVSMDQVLAGAGGWVNNGFQYATFGQVGQLLNDAGYLGDTSNYGNMRLVADNASANEFIDDFGSTSPPNFTYGFMAPYTASLGGATGSYTDYVEINANGAGGNGYAIPDSGPFASSLARPYVGSFLVRAAPVPEPETYVLMLAGLGLVAGYAKRRR